MLNLVLPPIVLHWSFQLCPLMLAERCLCSDAACRNLVGGAVAPLLSRSSAASIERTRGSGEKSTSEDEEEDDVVEEEELEDLRRSRCPLRPRNGGGLGGRWWSR